MCMDQKKIQQQVEQFLQGMGTPGFIIFGYIEPNADEKNPRCSIVSSFKDMPANAAIKGISKVLSDFSNKAL
jgi:hypothetical protein